MNVTTAPVVYSGAAMYHYLRYGNVATDVAPLDQLNEQALDRICRDLALTVTRSRGWDDHVAQHDTADVPGQPIDLADRNEVSAAIGEAIDLSTTLEMFTPAVRNRLIDDLVDRLAAL